MSLTDDQILGVLANMEQEQNFFEQMRASWKHVGEIIKRYKEIQARIPELEKEYSRISETAAGLVTEIESKRQAGLTKMNEEFDKTHAALSAKIEPLRVALKEASDRVTRAEAQAVEVEASCAERVKAAQSAASAAEARVAKAENRLSELRVLTKA